MSKTLVKQYHNWQLQPTIKNNLNTYTYQSALCQRRKNYLNPKSEINLLELIECTTFVVKLFL